VYQIVFTGFGGSSTGEYQFNLTLSSPLSTESSNSERFNLFPNPANGGMVTLSGSFGPNDRLEIFNLQGRLIRESRLQQSNSFQLSLGDIPSGTYLLRLISERGIQTQKLIIQK
jgi:hypothetical protein